MNVPCEEKEKKESRGEDGEDEFFFLVFVAVDDDALSLGRLEEDERNIRKIGETLSLTVRGVVPDPPRRLQLERVAVSRVAPVALGVTGTVAAAANLRGFFFF